MKSSERTTRTYIVWSACLVVFLVIAFLLNVWTAIVFALFALAFILDISPVVAFAIALGLLVFCPFMILLNQGSTAEIFASWSYCFIAIGIALQLYQYLRADPEKNEESE
jgi:hypothetical protein